MDIDFSAATLVTSGSAATTLNFTSRTNAPGPISNFTASALTVNVTGNLTVDGLNFSGVSGVLTLTATGDSTFQNNASSHSGGMVVEANNDINVKVDITSGVVFSATADNDDNGVGDFTLDSGVTVKATAGNIDIAGIEIFENGTLTASGDVIQNGVITQLNASDQSDLDSATNSSFVQDFTSTSPGC